jgi:hypothetical protein
LSKVLGWNNTHEKEKKVDTLKDVVPNTQFFGVIFVGERAEVCTFRSNEAGVVFCGKEEYPMKLCQKSGKFFVQEISPKKQITPFDHVETTRVSGYGAFFSFSQKAVASVVSAYNLALEEK